MLEVGHGQKKKKTFHMKIAPIWILFPIQYVFCALYAIVFHVLL